MIKKITSFFKKSEKKPVTYGNLTEDHLNKYYSKDEKHVYRRIMRYVWKQKKLFIPALVLNITLTFINILPPFVAQVVIALTVGKRAEILDKIPFITEFMNKTKEIDLKVFAERFVRLGDMDPMLIMQFGLVIILALVYIIGRVVLDYTTSFLFTFTNQAIDRDMKTDMLKGLLNTDIGYFKQEQEGVLMSRIGEASQISGFATNTIPRFITIPVTLILTVTMLFVLSVKLTLISMLVLPMIALGIKFISSLIQSKVTEQQNLAANMASIMQENIRGVEVVKIFSKEDDEISRYKKATDELIKVSRKFMYILAINRPMTEFIMMTGMISILGYGGYLVFNGEMPFEFLWGFLLYMLNVSPPIRDISNLIVSLKVTEIQATRVFQIIDLPPEDVDDKTKMKMKPITEGIIFDNVHFEYPKRDPNAEAFHLGPLNLNIKKGDVVAFVGASGGGKSTLIALIPKLFLPVEGRITFDNIDIRDINTRSLREKIGVVSQENIIFYGTIRDNIAYGDKNAKDEDVMHAAKIAHAHEFILKLPKGYDTHVGPRGVMLSGGQRQRIALARAVLRQPLILILDEATSALDTESEMHVQKALNTIVHLQTTFVIAHRLSTIKNANYICVIDDGKIIESGTHSDLMKHGGKYQYLYSLQFRD